MIRCRCSQLILMFVGHIETIQHMAYNNFMEAKCCDLTQLNLYFNYQYQNFHYFGHEKFFDAMYFTFFKSFGNKLGNYYLQKCLEHFVLTNHNDKHHISTNLQFHS